MKSTSLAFHEQMDKQGQGLAMLGSCRCVAGSHGKRGGSLQTGHPCFPISPRPRQADTLTRCPSALTHAH